MSTFRHLDNVNEQVLKKSSLDFTNLYVAQTSSTMDIPVVQLNTLEDQMHRQQRRRRKEVESSSAKSRIRI